MKILIFAGGIGSRLWPVSREKNPKQFQKIIFGKSLFKITVERYLKKYPKEDIFVVVPMKYIKKVKEECPDFLSENIIVEPSQRDNLACIGYSAFIIKKKFPNEVILISWSDHLIQKENTFLNILDSSEKYAKKYNKVVRIAVKPDFADINLGYLEVGKVVRKSKNFSFYEYKSHIEKPNNRKAQELFMSGKYLWNTGYMIWPIELLLKEYRKYQPETYNILKKITQVKKPLGGVSIYEKIPKISIDYGILEKSNPDNFSIVNADIGWSDLGDWNSMKKELQKDFSSNVLLGNTQIIELESSDNLLYSTSKNRKICMLGIKGTVIIETPEVLFIGDKSKSGELKKLVELVSNSDISLT